jgi:hypothetical protein
VRVQTKQAKGIIIIIKRERANSYDDKVESSFLLRHRGAGFRGEFEALDDALSDVAGVRDLLKKEGMLFDTRDAKCVGNGTTGDDELVIAQSARGLVIL